MSWIHPTTSIESIIRHMHHHDANPDHIQLSNLAGTRTRYRYNFVEFRRVKIYFKRTLMHNTRLEKHMIGEGTTTPMSAKKHWLEVGPLYT